MIITTKYKICKRLGAGVFEKCQTQKFALAKEQGGRPKRRPRALSAYASQLLEKQKARYSYGLTERQFRNYVKAAVEKRGTDSITMFLGSLEGRLDNVVYRLGLAKTRRQARQLVSHGHVMVNGKRVKVPSYAVSAGEKIAIRAQSAGSPLFGNLGEDTARVPSWLSVDVAKKEGVVLREPAIPATELLFDPTIVLQFYSR